MNEENQRPSNASLSGQEEMVLQGLLGGYTVRQIAKQIGISHYTVETYMSRIKRKLHCRTQAQIVSAYYTLTSGGSDSLNPHSSG